MNVCTLGLLLVTSMTAPPPLSSAPYPDGITDEAAYGAWLSAQADALAALPDPPDTTARARHLGYRANWIMAYRCEPYVSRVLLGIATSEDAAQLTAHATQARTALDLAAGLDGLPFELQDDLEYLMGINGAMTLLASAHNAPLETAQVSETTTELAVWLDDERAAVATNARLWQNLLFRASGQTGRALRSLPAAVEPLTDDRPAFFSRVLRCLVHADRGEYSLAAALLLKMEERCAQWFDKTTDATRAELTLLWFRLGVAERDQRPRRKLTAGLQATGQDRARGYLEEDQAVGLLRLHPAVPMVLERDAAPGDTPPPAEDAAEVGEID